MVSFLLSRAKWARVPMEQMRSAILFGVHWKKILILEFMNK
jgi:hypothetical protein